MKKILLILVVAILVAIGIRYFVVPDTTIVEKNSEEPQITTGKAESDLSFFDSNIKPHIDNPLSEKGQALKEAVLKSEAFEYNNFRKGHQDCTYKHGMDGIVEAWSKLSNSQLSAIQSLIENFPFTRVRNEEFNQVYFGPICDCESFTAVQTIIDENGLESNSTLGPGRGINDELYKCIFETLKENSDAKGFF